MSQYFPWGGVLSSQPVEAASASNGKIVYTKLGESGEIGDIFTMNSDGYGKTQLTSDGLTAPYGLSFATDGSKIVFPHVDQDADNYKISTMNANGSNIVYSSNTGYITSWLPNSSRVSYIDAFDDPVVAKTMNADGSATQSVYNVESEYGVFMNWTSDNTKVTYTASDGESTKIKISNADGTGGLFISDLAYAASPNFSTDNSKVYFIGSDVQQEEFSLYSVNVDGTSQAELASLPAGEAQNLVISPDGSKLLYVNSAKNDPEDDTTEAYVMNIDGSNQQQILPSGVLSSETISFSFSWSPDSTKVVYNMPSGGQHFDIFTVNADGTSLANLTNTPDEDEVVGLTTQAWGAAPATDTDSDNDGTPDSIEDAAPNNGDANNDGTPDSEQAHVTSLLDPVSGKYAVLAVSEQCSIEPVSIAAESSNEAADKTYDYPTGMMDFNLSCDKEGFTADISQYYFGQDSKGLILRKYNPITKRYSTIDSASISNETVASQTVAKATYQVTDGGELDLDNKEDGNIKDPSGLAAKTNALAATGESQIVAILASLSLIGFASILKSVGSRELAFRSIDN